MSLSDISLAKLFVSLGFDDPDGVIDTLEYIDELTKDISDSFAELDPIATSTLDALEEHGLRLSAVFTDVIESMEKIPADLRGGDAYVDVFTGEASNQIVSSALESAIEDLADNVNLLGSNITGLQEMSMRSGVTPSDSGTFSIEELRALFPQEEPLPAEALPIEPILPPHFDPSIRADAFETIAPDADLGAEQQEFENALSEFKISLQAFTVEGLDIADGLHSIKEQLLTIKSEMLTEPLEESPAPFSRLAQTVLSDLEAGAYDDDLTDSIDATDVDSLANAFGESLREAFTQILTDQTDAPATVNDVLGLTQETAADLQDAGLGVDSGIDMQGMFQEFVESFRLAQNELFSAHEAAKVEESIIKSDFGATREGLAPEDMTPVTDKLMEIGEGAAVLVEAFKEMTGSMSPEEISPASRNISDNISTLLTLSENTYERVQGLISANEASELDQNDIGATLTTPQEPNRISVDFGTNLNVTVTSDMSEEEIVDAIKQSGVLEAQMDSIMRIIASQIENASNNI